MDVKLHAFLATLLGEGEWSASHSGHFTPGEGALSTPRMGGWVGPRAGLDAVAKIRISSLPPPGIEPR